MQAMPRLIDDKRRKRRLVAFAILAFILTVSGSVWFINEQWRHRGLLLLHELEEQSSWIENAMDISRDADDVDLRLDVLSERMAIQDDISSSTIEFISATRNSECQEEAKVIAGQCAASVGELTDLRQRLSRLMSDGTNLMFRLKGLASSKGAMDVDSAQGEYIRRCAELQKTCEMRIVLTEGYKSSLAEHRKFADRVLGKKLNDGDWRAIEQGHLSYVNWTNDLAQSLAKYDAKDRFVHEVFQKLQQLPFDRTNTVNHVRTEMNAVMNRVTSLIACGTGLISSSPRRVKEIVSQNQELARTAFDSLTDLRKVHGEFVDASSVDSATLLFGSFPTLLQKAQKSVSDHIDAISEKNKTVAEAREDLRNALLSLEGNCRDIADERLGQICEAGLADIRDLFKRSDDLGRSIDSLTNYMAEVQAEAKDIADEIDKTLTTVTNSLPDWHAEGDKLKREFYTIRRDVERTRGQIKSLQQSFVKYRDKEINGTAMPFLRGRVEKVIENLDAVDADCSGETLCSNGVEMAALVRRSDNSRERLKLAEQEVGAIEKDLERFRDKGAVCRIKYIPFSGPFSSLMTSGRSAHHFDLPLNVPSTGHHQIELRFRKGKGFSLYQRKPQRKHLVEMRCAISGVMEKDDTLSWKDLSSVWQGSITLNENLPKGENRFSLDLTFTATDYRRVPLQGGTWQYRDDKGSESDTQAVFDVEFWVDGIKTEVLLGVLE